MVIIKIVKGDILNSTEKYIAHQCNCNTIKSKGLSKHINTRYEWANCYDIRVKDGADTPGTVLEASHPQDPDNHHKILCLMGQWAPGKPNTYAHYYPSTYVDSYENRKIWFQKCMNLLDVNNYDTIAMPYGIGCGLAGGRWSDYKDILTNSTTNIILYKL